MPGRRRCSTRPRSLGLDGRIASVQSSAHNACSSTETCRRPAMQTRPGRQDVYGSGLQQYRTSVLSCKQTTLRRLGRALANLSKIGVGRKPSASTQPGSRTRSRKHPMRKKQQCFRVEFDLAVHISQAQDKVYAPLGSHVGHLKTARAASGGCFPPMKDKTVPFNAGRTTWSLPRRPAKTFAEDQVLRGCWWLRGAMIESSRLHSHVVISGRVLVAKDARQGVPRNNLGRLRQWDVQTCQSRNNDWSDWRPHDRDPSVSVPRVHVLTKFSP